jgi:hypothetical protein
MDEQTCKSCGVYTSEFVKYNILHNKTSCNKYKMNYMIKKIRKNSSYKYESHNFMQLFKIIKDKNSIVIDILSASELCNNNYNKCIKDIINWYINNKKQKELKSLLKNRYPGLEVNKKQKYSYYKTGKYPTCKMRKTTLNNNKFSKSKIISPVQTVPKILVCDFGINKSNIKRNRIRKLLKKIL